MKKTKRIFAILMAVLMTMAVVPVAAFAEDTILQPEVDVPSLNGNYYPGEIIVGFGRVVTSQEVEAALAEIEYDYFEDLYIDLYNHFLEKEGKLNDHLISIKDRTFMVYLKENTKEAVVEALSKLVDNQLIAYAHQNGIFRPAAGGGSYYEVPDGYTVSEALEALRIAALIVPIVTTEQRDKYDMNGDKTVTVLDALAILRKAAGLEGVE